MRKNRRDRKRREKLEQHKEKNKELEAKLTSEKARCEELSSNLDALKRLSDNQKKRLKVKSTTEASPLLHEIDPQLLLKSKSDSYLGKGSFGTVELHHFHGYCVAVKQFDVKSSSKQDVVKEASIMAKLCHNNLPYLFGVCTKVEPYCIVSRFCEIGGKSFTILNALGDHECSTLPWFNLMQQASSALHYLHKAGYLHNDIKCDNILLTSNGSSSTNVNAVLNDFGKCTPVTGGKMYRLSSQDKQKYYKYHSHIAPEVIEGVAAQSTKSDIYSLGLAFYFVAKTFKNEALRAMSKLCTRSEPTLRCELAFLDCKLKEKL